MRPYVKSVPASQGDTAIAPVNRPYVKFVALSQEDMQNETNLNRPYVKSVAASQEDVVAADSGESDDDNS